VAAGLVQVGAVSLACGDRPARCFAGDGPQLVRRRRGSGVGQYGGDPLSRPAGTPRRNGRDERGATRRSRHARLHDRGRQCGGGGRREAVNGIHDMGGMHGMGPIRHEQSEPVFHETWEGRVYAISRALGPWGRWNIDASRYGIERLSPVDYLRMSYYEKWLARNIELLVKRGLVTQEEIDTGKPAA